MLMCVFKDDGLAKALPHCEHLYLAFVIGLPVAKREPEEVLEETEDMETLASNSGCELETAEETLEPADRFWLIR